MQPSKVPSVVALIESKGLKVRTTHRRFKRPIDKVTKRTPIVAMTTVSILDGDNILAISVALCSINDQFNRKRGRAIALGRAWKELNGRIKAAGAIGSQAFDS